jgi:hypothetical protein
LNNLIGDELNIKILDWIKLIRSTQAECSKVWTKKGAIKHNLHVLANYFSMMQRNSNEKFPSSPGGGLLIAGSSQQNIFMQLSHWIKVTKQKEILREVLSPVNST